MRLGDITRVIHGFAFSGMTADCPPPNPIVIGIGNFDYSGGFRFSSTTVKRFTGEYPREYELSPGDLLLAMTCQTPGGEILGIPGRVPDDSETYLHNQRLGRVEITEPESVDQAFLFQLARWTEFNRHLVVTASGSKILHTSPGRIEDFEFALPPQAEQRAIAATLGALDDKIESNRRAIGLLRELAVAALRAAVSGRRVVADVAEIRKGLSYKGAHLVSEGEGMPMVNMGNAENFGWLKRSGFKFYDGETKSKHQVAGGSLLVTGVEQTWKHEIIGWPLLVPEDVDGALFTHHMLLVDFAPHNEWMRLPLWAFLYTPEARAILEGSVYGTTVATLPVATLGTLEFSIPNHDSPSIPAAESMLRRAWGLERESQALADTRDTLLPALLSGKIRVMEAVV